ncbi:MAG: T9SS type A sorting domain-containing protein, partial [Paludibacter sp.]
IKIGSGAFVDPAASTFSGANLGTFNITTPLNISGSLNAYSTNSAVNVSDVSAKLYYQITKTGYDSGMKEVVLTNGGSTIQTGSVFTNATASDITSELDNGDYTLNVWYGTTNQTDVLLLDNSGSKYTASFKVYNVQHLTGTTKYYSSTSFTSTKKSVIVDDGELVIDQNAVADTITVKVGAKMTINSGDSISGIVNLLSGTTGTATLKDSCENPTVRATVQQYVEAGRNWYISSPLSSIGYEVLNRGTGVAEWNEGTKNWAGVTTGNLVAGKGYIQVATNNPEITGSTGNINFSGVTNSGNVSVPLTRTESGSSRGFNLVGNPYPSYLDWSLVIADAANSNISSTMWYRTKNTVGDYTFATHNGTSGETVTGTANTSITKFIPPMQAFWVRVNQNIDQTTYSASITFRNTMREHRLDAANIFKAPKAEERKRLRLQVSNGINADETVIYFDAKAQDMFDAYDSPKMSNNSISYPEIYTTVGNEKLVINGLNELTANEEIPIGFTTGQVNLFTIRASELTNFDGDTKIYLRDKLLNIDKDMTDGLPYTFTSDIISNSNRFSVVFKSGGVISGLVNNEVEPFVLIYKNANNQIVVNCKEDIDTNAYVSVYNSLGQKLVTQQLIDINTIVGSGLTSGVYLVKAFNGNKTTTQKVILN